MRGVVLIEIEDKTAIFVRDHRVGRLATASRDSRPVMVPICYAFDGKVIYSALDEKPKSTDVRSLKRVRNILSNPRVSLLIDDYSEDWSQLAYVLIIGVAEVVEAENEEHERAVLLLRQKYPQYASMAIETRPIIKISPCRITKWSAFETPS